MRALRAMACFLVVCGIGFSFARKSAAPSSQQKSTAAFFAPADAQKVRAEIRAVENALPKIPDRGAALFLLARRYAHLGELQKALALLKDCVALDAGFDPDPGESRSLRALAANPEFREMLEEVHRRYPPYTKRTWRSLCPRMTFSPRAWPWMPRHGSFTWAVRTAGRL